MYDELKFVRFPKGSSEPDWESAIPLNFIPDDGFIVICNKPAKNYDSTGLCTSVIRDFGPSNETAAFAILNGFEGLGYYLTDTVGGIGTNKGKIIMRLVFLFPIRNND